MSLYVYSSASIVISLLQLHNLLVQDIVVFVACSAVFQ